MNPPEMTQWLSLILSIIALASIIYGWFTSGSKKALSEVAKLREDCKEEAEELAKAKQTHADAIVGRFQMVESRLLKIESEMVHLPDREQTHRLEMQLERLTGRMETLDERLKPVAAIGDRLQEFLLEQAKSK